MDGRRAYAENFVRYYWRGAVVDGEFLRGVNLYVLGIFTYLVLYWAQMGRHYVTVCFLIALVVFNEIMVARWKRRGGELDFFQRHLLQGYLAAVGSLSFMLYPVVLVEQSGNVTLTLLFLAIMVAIWLILLLPQLLIPWSNIRREKTYIHRNLDQYGVPIATEKEKQAARRRLLVAVVLLAVCIIVYVALIFPHLGKVGVALNVLMLDVFLGFIFSVGVCGLLKAYYIKKYNIQGESIPAYSSCPEEKPTLLHRIVWGFLKWLGIGMAVMVQIGVFLMPR